MLIVIIYILVNLKAAKITQCVIFVKISVFTSNFTVSLTIITHALRMKFSSRSQLSGEIPLVAERTIIVL